MCSLFMSSQSLWGSSLMSHKSINAELLMLSGRLDSGRVSADAVVVCARIWEGPMHLYSMMRGLYQSSQALLRPSHW